VKELLTNNIDKYVRWTKVRWSSTCSER